MACVLIDVCCVHCVVRLDRVGALEVSSVPVNRYHLSPTPFMNATVNADNGDYYGYGPSGLINITNCAYKTDMFVSKPHFLDGDGALITNVTGLTPPNITAHDTYYDIEPVRIHHWSCCLPRGWCCLF